MSRQSSYILGLRERQRPAPATDLLANSTLSTHLATLEDHLRMKLCKRGRAGFELTSEGRVVYESAERMFQSLEEFRRSVQRVQVASPAQIRILVPDALLCTLFHELIPVFGALWRRCLAYSACGRDIHST